MAHERETLEAVIAARNSAEAGLRQAAANPGDGDALAALSSAEGALTQALGSFRVTMEAYPDLKANQNMMQLTETLESTENKVAFARQTFNDQIMAYNTYRSSFRPCSLQPIRAHQGSCAPRVRRQCADPSGPEGKLLTYPHGFFEAGRGAAKTAWLVVLFLGAVLSLIVLTNAAVGIAITVASEGQLTLSTLPPSLWVIISSGVLVIIFIGSAIQARLGPGAPAWP